MIPIKTQEEVENIRDVVGDMRTDNKPIYTLKRQPFSNCNIKARDGQLIQYSISIINDEIVLERPKNRKKPEIRYALNKVQCLKMGQTATGAEGRKQWAISLVSSSTREREIYFDERAA